jgi:hypothetical protein
MDPKTLFSALSIIFGSLSALCWLVSALVKVKANNAPKHDGWGGGIVQDSEGNDVVETLKKQSIWNTRAAILAALTAAFQVTYTYLS